MAFGIEGSGGGGGGGSSFASNVAAGAALGGPAGAALGAAYSIYEGVTGGRKARKRADKARRAQEANLHLMRKTAKQQIGIANQFGESFTEQGLPAISRFFDAAGRKGLDPEQEANLAGATVGQTFRKAIGAGERRLKSFGINPGDPRFKSTNKFRILQAATEAGMRNAARRGAKNLNFNRLTAAANFGRGMGFGASNILSSAASTLGAAAGVQGQVVQQATDIQADATGGILGGLEKLGQSGFNPMDALGSIGSGIGAAGRAIGSGVGAAGSRLRQLGGGQDVGMLGGTNLGQRPSAATSYDPFRMTS